MTMSTTLTRAARVRRSEDEWRALFARFERAGQTIEQFCTEQGLGLSTFSRWRQRLRGQVRAEPRGSSEPVFVELSTPEVAKTEGPDWDMELQLGADVYLRLRHARC